MIEIICVDRGGDEPDEAPDFEEWNWGRDHEPIVKVFMDQVATVLWDQMRKDMNESHRSATITLENPGGEPSIELWLLDITHILRIPLDEIELLHDGEEPDEAQRKRLIEIFKGWIKELEDWEETP